jgi:hypothetical protein
MSDIAAIEVVPLGLDEKPIRPWRLMRNRRSSCLKRLGSGRRAISNAAPRKGSGARATCAGGRPPRTGRG